jgi:lipid A disaccharide synthetase
MRREKKLDAIKKANIALNKRIINEFYGDNGDEENELARHIHSVLTNGEKEYGPLSPVQLITSAIDYARKADIRSGAIARALDYILKDRY